MNVSKKKNDTVKQAYKTYINVDGCCCWCCCYTLVLLLTSSICSLALITNNNKKLSTKRSVACNRLLLLYIVFHLEMYLFVLLIISVSCSLCFYSVFFSFLFLLISVGSFIVIRTQIQKDSK